MAAGRGGRDGRRSGAGKVDDGGDEARGRDARIRSEAVDERGRSLVMHYKKRHIRDIWAERKSFVILMTLL